eukprot:g70046.t1
MKAADATARNEEYFKRKIPVPWIKLFDKLFQEAKKHSWLSRDREEEVSPHSNDEVRLAVELQADASAAADQVFFKELGPSWVAGQAPGRSTEKYQAT